MSKKHTIKSHLLIGNKFLGALLYFKDKKGRGCIKLSFKNKIIGFVKGTDIMTILPVPAKMNTPISLDLSYKFQDSLLEVKKVMGDMPVPEFYDVALPVSTCLFFIRIKDWNSLDDAQPSKHQLILTPPNKSKNVAIIFSFLGTNNRPISPKGYDCLMRMIDVPEAPLSKLCIGIADDGKNADPNDFSVYIPLQVASMVSVK